MSTKTPEENESDMEAGMTTAERRRRRRRGGGLRVPSDNVPRRISSPAVAPMSEDPSVAIAYTGNGSEAPALATDPIAPEPINTFIDPPDQVEEINFDSKTREMSVVDLEELGLDAEAQLQARTVSTEIPITYSTVVVDDEMFSEAEVTGPPSRPEPSASITGQMGALTGGSSSAAIPIAGMGQASVSPPSGSATPPPMPPRAALTPATSSPAISISSAHHAPQAPSAFGTSPGHAPPPTQVASPLVPSQAPQGAHSHPQPPPHVSHQTPPAGSLTAPSPSVLPGGMTFSGLVSSGMTSAGVSLPVTPAPAAAPAVPAAPVAPAAPVSPPSAVTSSATGIPIAIGPSPSSAAIAVPVTTSQIANAATVPVTAPIAQVAHHEEPPPPPRIAKGRAQTQALSEDDLEEFLEENRLDVRGLRIDRQTSTSEEIVDVDVDVEVDSAAVPAALDERVAWKSERVIVSPLAAVPVSGPGPAERRSDRSIPAPTSAEAGAAEQGERRERLATPLGVPVSSANVGSAVGSPIGSPIGSPELGGRTKSASVPPPMPPAGHPQAQAAPASAPPSASALAAAAASAASSPAISIPGAPTGAPSASGLSSPSLTPPPAGAAVPGRATPPPSPAKPPPAPPKKAPDKRAAAVAAATQGGEQDKKPRSKAWFADVFDEDYLRTLPFLTPQATQAEAELVAASLGTSPGAKLLDVGCGYGRHAMELAARGYHVVGLDLSTPLLVRGGEEAHRRGLTINFIRGDMRELDFDGQFDGAYCLFSTFGYFDDETNKKTAGNIARALRPGGKCVFEILNRDYVIADLPTRVWWEGDGCVVLEEVDFNYFSSRICVNRSVVFDDGRQLEQEISIRAYSLHEVGKLMLAAGFRVLEVSGSYQTRGRFFGNQSRHIIVVAERTG